MLNPDDPDDCMTALEIGCQFARENASNCQSAVFVQTDGVGHKVHAHIITNDVKITDFKGLDHSARHHSEFSRTVDRICARTRIFSGEVLVYHTLLSTKPRR